MLKRRQRISLGSFTALLAERLAYVARWLENQSTTVGSFRLLRDWEVLRFLNPCNLKSEPSDGAFDTEALTGWRSSACLHSTTCWTPRISSSDPVSWRSLPWSGPPLRHATSSRLRGRAKQKTQEPSSLVGLPRQHELFSYRLVDANLLVGL